MDPSGDPKTAFSAAPAVANDDAAMESTTHAAEANTVEPTRLPLTRENLRRCSEADSGRAASTSHNTKKDSAEKGETVKPSLVDVDAAEPPRELLLQRVAALERQLRIRNADCSRLLQERHALLPLKQKSLTQEEMIEALQDKVQLLEAQRASAQDTIEQLRRQIRDKEHQERISGFQKQLGLHGVAVTSGNSNRIRVTSISSTTPPQPPRPSQATNNSSSPAGQQQQQQQQPPSSASQQRLAPGGTVVSTSTGPQIIYDSSDISSVGFQPNAKLPYDFLGGPAAQQQYQIHARQQRQQQQQQQQQGLSDNALGTSEEAEVNTLMDAARQMAEVDSKYAEVDAREEQELRARLAALKKR